MADEEPSMAKPAFRWGWNINTIAVLIGFAGMFVAWGYTWAEVKVKVGSVDRLGTRLTAVAVDVRRLDNHELRLTTVEKQATDATAMRAVETTLNALAADMRVTREILQRLEASERTRLPNQHPMLGGC